MKIRFWGTRGSIPTPGKDKVIYGGNTTCVEVISSDGQRVIIDAGSGIRALGEQLMENREHTELYLLITHIHWDHLLGFPFFSPIHDKDCTIKVDGYPACMKGIRYPFDNQMGDGFFPISFEDLEAQITYIGVLKREPLRIGSMVITKVALTHPQGGFGFRFQDQGREMVFITDNELIPDSEGTGNMDQYIQFCKDAHLLIHDAQYSPTEILKRRGWGHSNYEDTIDLAIKAGVQRLLLFHHDPTRTDEDLKEIEKHCQEMIKRRGSGLQVEAAREGQELVP